ncbi:MAG: EAL domain-containing protein [Planctomycetaceae bacterium]
MTRHTLSPASASLPAVIDAADEGTLRGDEQAAAQLTSRVESFGRLLELQLPQSVDSDAGFEVWREFDLLCQAANQTVRDLRVTETRSEALARAQADALVYSAEVIDELEQTKQSLNEARAAAEQAACDTQQLADTIFARTNDAVLILHDGVCVSCNDNAVLLFGCRKSELVGSWPVPLTSDRLEGGADAFRELNGVYQSAMDGSTGTVEVACRREDGRLVWCEIKMTGFLMQDDRHILATVCDITTRKNFEGELRRHRDFLNNIINAVPDPLYVSDQRQRLVVANDSYCRSFELDRDEVLGRDFEEIFPGEQGRRIRESEQAAFQARVTTQEERTQRLANGATRIHAIRRSVFDDAVSGGGDAYVVGVSRDITLEREHQKRLSLLASVFNNAAEGVAIMTRDGRIVEANPRLAEMFNCGDLTGRQLSSVVDLSIDDLANELVRVSMGSPWSGKISADLPGGRQQWYWLSLSRNEAADGCQDQIIALFSDVTQLENSQRQLKVQALHDNLTSLPNRRFFRQYVDDLIRDQASRPCAFSVCFMDLDEFKSVNDSLGHGIGDQLLIAVGNRLSETIGSQAFIARFGGDEFAAVFPQRRAHDDSVEQSVQRLIAAIQEPFSVADNEITIGLSIGIATYAIHGEDADTLMSNADIAMYAAKAAGKNQARCFSPEMQERADQRHFLQAELRRVLHGGGISLVYQPKACAKTGAPRGCEALARWNRPDGSSVSPAEFIPIAEQSGVILQLGEFVIAKALEACRDWADRGLDLFPVAVNISPQQLRSVRFVERLLELLAEYDGRPEWLELEITENAMVEDIGHAIATIDRLVEAGFRIAIDDFGTGYSSLSYLRFFRIHTVKIDRSFVSEITQDRNCAAIADSIISLGHGLDLTVVAEGVETAEQLELLARAGCDIAQGYYIGHPVSKEAVEQWRSGQPVACSSGIEMQQHGAGATSAK